MKRFEWYRNLSMLALVALLVFWWSQRYEIAKDRLHRELQLSVDEQLATQVLEIFRFDSPASEKPEIPGYQFEDSSEVSMQVVILGDTLAERVIDSVRTDNGVNMSITKVFQDSSFAEGLLKNWMQNKDRLISEHLDSLSNSLNIEIVRHDTIVAYSESPLQLNLKQNKVPDGHVDIATVEQYQKRILLSMWPEVLAGSFILFLMGLAFRQSGLALKRQERLIKDKDELMANMAHELKTPIAGVSAALEALEHFDAETDSSKFKDYIKLSRIEMDRLDKLADQSLLSLQLESEAGSTTAVRERIDLRKSLLKSWEPVCLRHHLDQDQLKLEGDNWPLIMADDRYLSTILTNLLSNAVKYGGSPLALLAKVEKSENYARLWFADCGPGVAADQADRIFERFYRIKSADGHRVKGNGLGLSLSRQLARAMHGDLWLDKSYTDGAAFVLKLPTDGGA